MARRLNSIARARTSEGRILPPLILMTDVLRLAEPAAAVSALPAGSAVILRHYGAPDRGTLARRLVALCRRVRVRLLIAADARLAAEVGADGLHLPEALARRGAGPWRRRPDWIVTAAAHSPAALRRAAAAGADAALLAPVFPTSSHPEAPAIGLSRFAAWCRESPLPVYALGGVSGAAARRLIAAGAAGLAGTGGLSPVSDPCTRAIKEERPEPLPQESRCLVGNARSRASCRPRRPSRHPVLWRPCRPPRRTRR